MTPPPVPPERRPGLYRPLAEPVGPPPAAEPGSVEVACPSAGPDATVESWAAAVRGAAEAGADLVVLPELAGVDPDASGRLAGGDVGPAAAAGERLVAELSAALAGTSAHAATTVAEVTHDGPALVAVVVGAGGPALQQPALHRSARHRWQRVLGDRQKALAVPGGAVAVLAGDDALVPEAARLAVLAGATVLTWPAAALHDRSAAAIADVRSLENAVDVVVAGPGWCRSALAAGTVRRVWPPEGTPDPT